MSTLSFKKSSLDDIVEETESENGTLTATANSLATPDPKKRKSTKPPASNSKRPHRRSPNPPRRPVREMLNIMNSDKKTLPPNVRWLVTFPEVNASQTEVRDWLMQWNMACPHMMSTVVPCKEARGTEGVRRDVNWFGQRFGAAAFTGLQLRAWKWSKIEKALRKAGMDKECRRLLMLDLKIAKKMTWRVEVRVKETLCQWRDDVMDRKTFQRPIIYRNPFVKTYKQLTEYEQLAVNEQVAEAKAKANDEEANDEETTSSATISTLISPSDGTPEENEQFIPKANYKEANTEETTSSATINTATASTAEDGTSEEQEQFIPKTKAPPRLRKLWSIARPAPCRFPSSFWESLSLV